MPVDDDPKPDVFANLSTLFQSGVVGTLADGPLLERVKGGRRDAAEVAFAALVERHGPMVLRVCRDVLRDAHDAEDAFQATFLVLARRSGTLWVRDSLGPWLHAVACRVAACARATARRRRAHEREASWREDRAFAFEEWDDLAPVLHEEVDRLPERFRTPIVLCYLEGMTHEQAADQLRWPVGTVRSRLARGRDRLRGRLARRGLAPSAIAEGIALPTRGAPLSPTLADATARAGSRLASGDASTVAGTSAHALSLSQSVLRRLFMDTVKTSIARALLVGLATVGIASLATGRGPADGQAPARPPAKAKAVVEAEAKGRPKPTETPAPATSADEATPPKVVGRVVDAEGRPVAGVDVSTYWRSFEGMMRPFGGVTTDRDGRFALGVTPNGGRYQPLLAVDRGSHRGGMIVLDQKAGRRTVEIRLGGLVRVHGRFSCEAMGTAPAWTNVYMNVAAVPLRLPDALRRLAPGRIEALVPAPVRLVMNSSSSATFDLWVPPGNYEFQGYGTYSDFRRAAKRSLTLKADTPDVDLGTIDLTPTPMATQIGKEAPSLKVTDARGVGQKVKLADYRGKWVVLEFWASWCGPCVIDSLPRLIKFDEEYRDFRDKFAILTFHDASAKTFAELDPKMETLAKSWWQGKPLPFPILLDASGETIARFGVRSFPDVYLIDPEGKVVELNIPLERFLGEKLRPTPEKDRILQALDHEIRFAFDRMPLDETIWYFTRFDAIKIEVAPGALAAVGTTETTPIPLVLTGNLTLRSWLELVLEPLGLTYEARETSLVIIPKGPNDPARPATAQQRKAARQLEEELAKVVDVDFRQTPLAEAVEKLTEKTRVPIALDPECRKSGTLDPDAAVTGTTRGLPLREALTRLTRPLGLTPIIRSEVVLLTSAKAGHRP